MMISTGQSSSEGRDRQNQRFRFDRLGKVALKAGGYILRLCDQVAIAPGDIDEPAEASAPTKCVRSKSPIALQKSNSSAE
ncbi:MAG: hypothetical protein HC879_11095 [Leptolyngbyaceae cyanobacterium SL_5_9]|nr:hypothetical protein [Leptolyngbyaceae cyanobacterium SL_5_9]NJO76427.1 hypothetical protein [Leptolyngbyaceae cyanobacterium RM1_406_9]